jgi:trk system potassium uptake protein TrkA
MNVVIMGSGRTGSLLAAMLDEVRQDVTIIDWDSAAFDRLPETFSGRTIVGNAVDQDVQRQAGVETADVFVSATSGDNRNIMAGQVAKEVFDVPRVILRIKDPNRAAIYSKLGLQVDCRTSEGVRVLLDLVDGAGEQGLVD